MTKTELKEKAQSLPLAPGVYLMQNKANEVIYVGKAKKLRNRVSQYFLDSSTHTAKTRLMVSKVDHFDVIIAASEFEALVLECSLIKRYLPKYNILLKDDKGYPWLRLDPNEAYPTLTLASKVREDGAKYYGPYGGRYLTQKVIDTLRLTFRLPNCSRVFPRDIGRERPCLNFQMGNCDGWCRGEPDAAEYRARIRQVQSLLAGNYKGVAEELKGQMLAASDALEFERAAQLRDRMNAIEALGQKQLVTAGRMADTDAVGYYETEARGCFAVLHYVGGSLLEKDYELVPATGSPEEALSSLLRRGALRADAPAESRQKRADSRAPARGRTADVGACRPECAAGGGARHQPGGASARRPAASAADARPAGPAAAHGVLRYFQHLRHGYRGLDGHLCGWKASEIRL